MKEGITVSAVEKNLRLLIFNENRKSRFSEKIAIDISIIVHKHC